LTILLATKNKKKINEIKRMFSGMNIRFLTLDSFPDCLPADEDGESFRENAVKKAVHIAQITGLPALADDSGLEVKALGGAPGVFSARYAGEKADDQKNVKKLLSEMKKLKDEERRARFVCCIAFALPDGNYKTFTGYVSGVITRKNKGFKGFGYDPVFCPAGYSKTFAEMTGPEKDSLSHRGRALKKFRQYLRKVL
jgi:XTP/dITP diphosphohydrolase